MSSIRRKLTENVNNSKNTRLDIGGALTHGDLRADNLAHMSRYGTVARLLIEESRMLNRPVTCLEVGCGELWAIRVLMHAYTVKKSTVVSQYTGVDIDPIVKRVLAPGGGVGRAIPIRLVIQDITVKPRLPVATGSIDVFWSTEVIEHMRPEFVAPWLEDANRCLRKGGLIYISTPNANGSKDELPEDHVYEWGYRELYRLLTKFWRLESVTGTFIQLPIFERAQKQYERIPRVLEAIFRRRFDTHWLRNVLAAPYPEFANNCAWVLRKLP
jgi:SAM-dependent methyltransferase